MPASVAQVVGDGVDERRTPPTVGCRTRGTEWGERRRSSAQGQFRGNRLRESCCYVGDEEDAARPGSHHGNGLRGSCEAWSGQPASQWQTGACRSCGTAGGSHAAGMWNRSGRKTHSDRLLRTKRKARSAPDVQRKKRSTPTARPVPSERRTNVKLQPPDWCPRGEGPTSNFNRRTGPRTKDQCQLRRFGPRCLRRTNVKLRIDSIPSWETLWSTRATGITHPGFYGWKPWKKPNNAPIITAPTTPR